MAKISSYDTKMKVKNTALLAFFLHSYVYCNLNPNLI